MTSTPLPPLLLRGDCLARLKRIPDASVDAVVTDPPYGLANTDPAHVVEALTHWAQGERDYLPTGKGFMGHEWDAFVPPPAVWDECMRILKPGGHVLAFAGSRTFDLMTLSIRMAGFDIRDSLAWLYGSGFPKSLDVSKAIDKRPGVARHAEFAAELTAAREAAGLARQDVSEHVVGTRSGACWNWEHHQFPEAKWWPALRDLLAMDGDKWDAIIAEAERAKTGTRKTGLGTGKGATAIMGDNPNRDVFDEAHTDAAREWQGWGTALKPAFEPIVMARKPLIGTVAANVLAHGTGALNIDATRIGSESRTNAPAGNKPGGASLNMSVVGMPSDADAREAQGRWPANVILDESQAAALDEQSGTLTSGKFNGARNADKFRSAYGAFKGTPAAEIPREASSGGASRFFYVAKAPKSERPVVDGTVHPTVKPLAVMRWLIRLVTPPGGCVVDPFAGSGTTLEAAYLEGMESIGVELTPDYWPLIESRIARVVGDESDDDEAA